MLPGTTGQPHIMTSIKASARPLCLALSSETIKNPGAGRRNEHFAVRRGPEVQGLFPEVLHTFYAPRENLLALPAIGSSTFKYNGTFERVFEC